MATDIVEGQLSLFDRGDPEVENRWQKYHEENPHVYVELRKLALQLRHRGRERYSIVGLFEVLRWHRALETEDPDGWKLNNNYRPYYARLLMKQEPDLVGFFETRVAKADEAIN